MRQLNWLMFALLLHASTAYAQVPHLVRYQGFLKDSQGAPLEGPYTLTFRLYAAATGGNPLWIEPQNVSITGGNFSVLLGSVTTLDTVDWSQPQWLSIQVNSSTELTPWDPITSVPLAIRAETAEIVKTSGLTDDAHNLVPPGGIILWDGAACPAGYTRNSAYDDRFLVASSIPGTPGGNNTHDHGGQTGSHALTINEIPPHSHGLRGHSSAGGQGPNWFPNTSDGVYTTTESAGGGAGHTHTLAPADSRPAFKTILLCQKD